MMALLMLLIILFLLWSWNDLAICPVNTFWREDKIYVFTAEGKEISALNEPRKISVYIIILYPTLYYNSYKTRPYISGLTTDQIRDMNTLPWWQPFLADSMNRLWVNSLCSVLLWAGALFSWWCIALQYLDIKHCEHYTVSDRQNLQSPCHGQARELKVVWTRCLQMRRECGHNNQNIQTFAYLY